MNITAQMVAVCTCPFLEGSAVTMAVFTVAMYSTCQWGSSEGEL